jgi:hypothetical protein
VRINSNAAIASTSKRSMITPSLTDHIPRRQRTRTTELLTTTRTRQRNRSMERGPRFGGSRVKPCGPVAHRSSLENGRGVNVSLDRPRALEKSFEFGYRNCRSRRHSVRSLVSRIATFALPCPALPC